MDFVMLDGNSDEARKCLKDTADALIAQARAIQKYLQATERPVQGRVTAVTAGGDGKTKIEIQRSTL